MPTITANVPLLNGVFDITINGSRIDSVTPSDKTTDIFAGPTLFDIQVNGYAGRTCRIKTPAKKDAPRFITTIFRERGIGWWVPTITTAGTDTLLTAFTLFGEALDDDPDTAKSIPGLHLEGPYISPVDGPRGAHNLEYVKPPDFDEFMRFQDACGGRIIYVTIAPEREGAIPFIEKCVQSGVVVSMGHTNLDRDAYRRAIDAGATMSTHLGNGAHDMIQRHNNYIWYQLAGRKNFASFISDGHHLPEECLYSMVHAKGLDRSIVTSDSIQLGGMKPGVYSVRERKIEKLPSGRVVLRGTPNLAGSANNLKECVENVIRMAQISHADGWKLASLNPATMLGLDDKLGIGAGKEATLTVYRYNPDGPVIDVLETWVAGKKVFDAATDSRTPMPEKPLDLDD